MSAVVVRPCALEDGSAERTAELFAQSLHAIRQRTDRMFGYLMIGQWLAGIAAAVWISPRTWIGTTSYVHWHVWAAIFLGGVIAALPVFLAWKFSGQAVTRHTIAVAQMLTSGLLIHLTGGRIETHFHVFGSLAFLAVYRDWRVLLTASVVAALDHMMRGSFWPQSVFGVLAPGPWRWLEHAGWVLFEDAFLFISIRQSLRDLREVATRRAHLEAVNAKIEQEVAERTQELTLAHTELQASENRFSSAFTDAAIGMALVAPTGHWLKVNRALCDLLGYSAEELCRKTFQDVTHPDDLEKDLAQARLILAGAINSYHLEKRYHHKQGAVVSTLLSVSLVRDATGAPRHFISQIQDITERKHAEAELARTHQELLEVSRRAGMAEVATGVLHNVGNVLNSVNVGATYIGDELRKSKAPNLARVVTLLRENEAHLTEYLAQDPKGRQLLPYLAQLAGHLADEQTLALKELAAVQKHIDHIKDIVALQQSFAKVSGVAAPVPVVDLLEEALRVNESSLHRHAIKVVKEFGAAPVITVEKHKVLQILVNLLRNAKQACDGVARDERQITLQVQQHAERVAIIVADNGVGIPAENLTRIFSHGFTTKKDGHGFGLHSGALAAQEMGGTLQVASAGTGQGARFTLELPAQPTRRTA